MLITYKITDKTDIDTLLQIRLEMLKVVNELPEDYSYSQDFIAASRTYFLEGNQTTVLAYDGNKAVGCATMSYLYIMPTFSHPTGNRGHLMNVYTNKNYRRMGIGKQMLQILIDDCKQKGATEISLDATEMGKPLYEAMGFIKSDAAMAMNL